MINSERFKDENFLRGFCSTYEHIHKNFVNLEELYEEIYRKNIPDNMKTKFYTYHKYSGNYNLGYLVFYAKQDNTNEYKKFLNAFINDLITRYYEECNMTKFSMKFSDRNFATLIHYLQHDELRCSNLKDGCYFYFKNHIWNKDDSGQYIRNYMSTDLLKIIENHYYNICNEEQRKKYKNTFNKALDSLKDSTSKAHIAKECKDLLFDEDLILDKNPNIIAYKNGVYDLNIGIFRKGNQQDYLSKSIKYDYVEFNKTDNVVIELKMILKQIFPDKSLRKYFMNTTCEFYEGFNKRKIVLIWSGIGNNGKSVIMKFIETLFGKSNLINRPSTTLITGDKTSCGSSCQELSRTDGVRLLVFDEPTKKEIINGGMLKLLSGGDSFFARGLFKDGGEIEPFFKIVMICNDKPKIDAEDKALFNRLRVLPFESEFVDNPPKNIDEQFKQKKFKKNPELLESEYKKYIEAFNWLMLQHLKKIKNNPNLADFIPEKVLYETNKYKNQNDFFGLFLTENIKKENNSMISVKAIYELFKDWYKNTIAVGSNGEIPSRKDLEAYLLKTWGPSLAGYRYSGYRFLEENEINMDVVDIVEKLDYNESIEDIIKSNNKELSNNEYMKILDDYISQNFRNLDENEWKNTFVSEKKAYISNKTQFELSESFLKLYENFNKYLNDSNIVIIDSKNSFEKLLCKKYVLHNDTKLNKKFLKNYVKI